MTNRTLSRIALVFVCLMLLALGGWYLFLSRGNTATENLGAARGFGESVPLFGDDTGSTYANLSSAPGAGESEALGRPPQLWRVTATPVAGAGFITASSTTLLFVERSTGYVFSVSPETSAVKRLTNTLFARVYEAFVGSSGRSTMRFMSESGVLSGVIGTASSTQASANEFVHGDLPPHTKTLALSPDGSEVFYLIPDGAGAFAGVRTKEGEAPKKVLSTFISGWNAQWVKDDGVVLTERPASDIESSSYVLADDGVLTPLVRRVEGLSVRPDPESGALLFSSSADGGVSLFAQAGSGSSPVRLPLSTIADKCTWSGKAGIAFCAVPKSIAPGAFLDSWLRGVLHTEDTWWRVDARTGGVEELYTGDAGATLPDVTNPNTDATGSYISFIDGKTLSLWIFRIQK